MLENIGYCGELHLTLRDPDGNIKDERRVKNTLLDTGKDLLIKNIMGNSGLTAMTVFYIGHTTSGGNAASGDTTGETAEDGRLAFTYTSGGTVGQCSATATFGASGAGGPTTTAITEAGIFNGAAATSGDGVFFARAIFAAINKGASDSLEIKWDVSFS